VLISSSLSLVDPVDSRLCSAIVHFVDVSKLCTTALILWKRMGRISSRCVVGRCSNSGNTIVPLLDSSTVEHELTRFILNYCSSYIFNTHMQHSFICINPICLSLIFPVQQIFLLLPYPLTFVSAFSGCSKTSVYSFLDINHQ
jgi:hypothetical protein